MNVEIALKYFGIDWLAMLFTFVAGWLRCNIALEIYRRRSAVQCPPISGWCHAHLALKGFGKGDFRFVSYVGSDVI